MKPKTVQELIELLKQMPPDALVVTEGCDCVGPWSGEVERYATHDSDHTYVCINRDDDRKGEDGYRP